jgi:predicted dehydrogenase
MPLRLAMLGMWHTHADGIVRQIAENSEEFALVGFHDRDPELVAQRAAQWEPRLGKLNVFDTAESLVREKLDGVIVEGRVHENVRLARLAIDEGKPVLLEKPAGDNLDDFRRLLDQAQKKHLHVQMIYLFRYMAAVQEMLQRVGKQELGHIYHFRARLPKDLPSYQRYVEELGQYKGGMFFEMAGHVIDMMIAMLGTPRSITPFLGHHHRVGPADFIDNGLAVFEYPHAWASVEVAALEVAPHARRLEVFGAEGAFVIPHLGSGHLANKNVQPVELYRRGQDDWQTFNLPARTLQISDLREFAQVIAGKKRPDFSMEHDLAVQETLLRASGMLAGNAERGGYIS